jgi:hypothetical protein
MPATKAKPRSAKVAKAKPPSSRRRMARAAAVPAKPTRSIEFAAYYIAGQAAVALGIGDVVYSAEINPEWDYEGMITFGIDRCRYEESRQIIYLAGPFAQRWFAPRSNWRSGNDDFDIVKKERYGRGHVWSQELAIMEHVAIRLVAYFWYDIEAVGKALLRQGALTLREIREVISEARSKRRARPRDIHPLAHYPDIHPMAHYRALSARWDVDLMQSAIELNYRSDDPPRPGAARIAAVIASDRRFAYFGTTRFAERLLRLEQKLADGWGTWTPKRTANLLNTKSELLQEFCGHFADSDDGTVTLDVDGRAFVIPVFGLGWAPGG